MLRRLFAFIIAGLTVLGLVGLVAPAANASSAGTFVAKINAARRAVGRPALSTRGDLAAVAYRHSQRMASRDSLYHNPNLAREVTGWKSVGENVGRGGDVNSLHQAFMNSPTHRANIVDRDFTEVGVGVVVDGHGIMWVTEVFRKPMRAPATRTPAPKRTVRKTTPRPTQPAPRTAPRPVAPARPKAAAPSRSAILLARLAALSARPPARVDGALPRALSYLEVMSALGR